jgi:hypothetical protein
VSSGDHFAVSRDSICGDRSFLITACQSRAVIVTLAPKNLNSLLNSLLAGNSIVKSDHEWIAGNVNGGKTGTRGLPG